MLANSFISVLFFGMLFMLSTYNFDKEPFGCDECQEFLAQRAVAYADGATFGTKTAYLFDAPWPRNETTLGGCTAVQLYVVVRHGTRNPSKKDVVAAANLQERLQLLLTQAVVTEVASKLGEWTTPFGRDDAGMLSLSGMKEIFCLAERFQSRFPTLLPERYLFREVLFRATFKPRTVQSVLSFAHGLYSNHHASLFGYQPIHVQNVDKEGDDLLRFFSMCPAYSRKVKNNQDVHDHVSHFLATNPVRSVLERIQEKLDPEQQTWNVTAQEAIAMFRQCAFEKASYGSSIWCGIFSSEDVAVLEYFIDLENYWKKGYGHPINWQMSCPLVSDVLLQLSSAARRWEEEGKSAKIFPAPKTLIRMGHSETLVPLVCLLGMFKDGRPLPTDNYQSERRFKTYKFAGFAGNVALVLYHCPKLRNKFLVRTLVNERDVRVSHPACDFESHHWCPLGEFPDVISDLSGGFLSVPCNLTELCT